MEVQIRVRVRRIGDGEQPVRVYALRVHLGMGLVRSVTSASTLIDRARSV
jgi:hypothetical protein